ncbi:regulatory protein, TetR [Luminiphilus syltensis NOR5-1B]|uniref:Nucleoid occlusion factor SlmA n=1 Tax=Luminiphilus syltensis NOR5-1B TaxID=565045 RepID=B8KU99_9GAMM|nr:nucleoid occlusion factor SlmA [Luminiphilus syltensis]EED36936.1 regulatory protein, TetR [Luminiphilus syltensis NOR5-1B]
MPPRRSDRRDQILQALAEMLEANPGERITTAKLAAKVGVSEAALYRHFPSKNKMFEALIEFVEDTLFSRINRIVAEEETAMERCRKIVLLLLSFCERNPGITRVLNGEALIGETERLHIRAAQVFERLETQLRQTLRQAELEENQRPTLALNDAANLLLSCAEGRIAQYVRSNFRKSPTVGWNEQWLILTTGFMRDTPGAAERPAINHG